MRIYKCIRKEDKRQDSIACSKSFQSLELVVCATEG